MHGHLGQLLSERAEQCVALAAVAAALAAQVAVELAALDQLGKRELLQGRRHSASQSLRVPIGSTSRSGSASQPSLTAGASVLLVEPPYTTWSGARPCNEPIGWRS